jgi:hypothetical protein
MRVFGQITTAVCLVAVAAVPEAQQKPEATAILAQAREALGGEAKLTAVKNFVVTGRTRRIQGSNLVPVEFEIAVEFPDKYVRKDEIPAQESGPTSNGFNGEAVIQLPVPVAPPPRAGGPGGRVRRPVRRRLGRGPADACGDPTRCRHTTIRRHAAGHTGATPPAGHATGRSAPLVRHRRAPPAAGNPPAGATPPGAPGGRATAGRGRARMPPGGRAGGPPSIRARRASTQSSRTSPSSRSACSPPVRDLSAHVHV